MDDERLETWKKSKEHSHKAQILSESCLALFSSSTSEPKWSNPCSSSLLSAKQPCAERIICGVLPLCDLIWGQLNPVSLALRKSFLPAHGHTRERL
ncbi:hypothetical protein PM082_023150 [Marasmius tenuissimus]|nr:hypothetical protein PM082_023150 [Marasmius tenuissimus]